MSVASQSNAGSVASITPHTETMILNMGPHHPSTHGVLRLILELDGETVVKCTPDIGYLHTGIEKTAESLNYTQSITLFDRTDYLAPLSNNLGLVLAYEKLLGIEEVPPRAQILRVLLVELQRIASHLVWLGTQALDIGAVSVFLYCFREREKILDIFEWVSGVRMMTSYLRVGGTAKDVPPGFEEMVREFLRIFPARIAEYEALLTKNQIWIDRTRGIGVLSAPDAIDLGVSGPLLRASGVDWDIRKSHPYSGYAQFDFDIPLGTHGDVYDRYLCRIQEMRESLKIVEQALRRLPKGPVLIDDRKIVPPPKDELAHSMEAVIHHFKLWTEGFKVLPGEVYVSIESPRGELGYYVVSDGSAKPYRVRVRAPSFVNLQTLPRIVEGRLVADVVACIASIDIVLGEIDR